jgi:hypothetical protein
MLGSARVPRAGDDALVIANLSSLNTRKNIKSISARAPKICTRGRVRSPEVQFSILLNFAVALP